MSCFRLSFAKQKLRLELTSACSVNQLCSLEEEGKNKLPSSNPKKETYLESSSTSRDTRRPQVVATKKLLELELRNSPPRLVACAKRYRLIEACFNCNTTIVKPSFYPNTQQQHYHGQFDLYHRFPEPIQRVGYIRSTLSTRRMR